VERARRLPWVEFLDSLDGYPQVIVPDADATIRRAIGLFFPATELLRLSTG
jgi:hypothetical protein